MSIAMIKTKDGFVPAEKVGKNYKPVEGAKLVFTKKGMEVQKEGSAKKPVAKKPVAKKTDAKAKKEKK